MRRNDKQFFICLLTAFLLIFTCTSLPLWSQERPAKNINVYLQLNEILQEHYGSSDLLINGILYQPLHSKAEGNPYYPTEEFTDGKIFISGKSFGPEQIKFNIELQQLILKRKISKEAVSEILLNNSLVDSFFIRDKLFINNRFIPAKDSTSGFMEVIHRDDYAFYAYVKKIFKDDYTRSTPFGRYQQMPPTYLLVRDSESRVINSRRDFLSIFGEDQRNIKKYMKQEGIKFKKASSKDLSNIIRYSESIYRK